MAAWRAAAALPASLFVCQPAHAQPPAAFDVGGADRHRLQDLAPGVRQPLAATALAVTADPLAHAGVESTAFLIDHGDQTLSCLGDTGPDAVEQSGHPTPAWLLASLRSLAALTGADALKGLPGDPPHQGLAAG